MDFSFFKGGRSICKAAVQGHRRVPSGLAENPQRRRDGALRQAGQVPSIRLGHPGKNNRWAVVPVNEDSLIRHRRTVCLVLLTGYLLIFCNSHAMFWPNVFMV